MKYVALGAIGLTISLTAGAFEYPAYVGRMTCEDKIVVTVTADKKRENFYSVQIGKTVYKTERIATASGAIRLEDKARGVVWLQMSNKSMLLNEKLGKRIVTNCQNDDQKIVQKHMDMQSLASN